MRIVMTVSRETEAAADDGVCFIGLPWAVAAFETCCLLRRGEGPVDSSPVDRDVSSSAVSSADSSTDVKGLIRGAVYHIRSNLIDRLRRSSPMGRRRHDYIVQFTLITG